MSEIRFIKEFGEVLQAAIAVDQPEVQAAAPRSRTRDWIPRWLRGRRGHLVIGLTAVAVAGCAATVAFYNPADTTVAYGITCINRSGQVMSPATVVNGSLTGSNVTYGPDPLVLCHNSLELPVDRLIVCVQPTLGVFVLPRDGSTRQCAAHGWQSYTHSYVAAVHEVGDLENDLLSLYASRACWSPKALVAAAQRALVRNKLVGWGTYQQPISPEFLNQFPGHCGNFLPVTLNQGGAGHAYGMAGTVGIDPQRHTVDIYESAPRPEILALSAIQQELADRTIPDVGDARPRITTLAQLRRIVLNDLAANPATRGLRLSLQVSRQPQLGLPAEVVREDRYIFSHGGVVSGVSSPALSDDGRTFIVQAGD